MRDAGPDGWAILVTIGQSELAVLDATAPQGEPRTIWLDRSGAAPRTWNTLVLTRSRFLCARTGRASQPTGATRIRDACGPSKLPLDPITSRHAAKLRQRVIALSPHRVRRGSRWSTTKKSKNSLTLAAGLL